MSNHYLKLKSNSQNTIKKLFKNVIEAVSGTQQDFTTGSLKRAIFLLSVPMVLEMLMESIFAIVDIFFVSKLGADAIATVGITESFITIVYSIAIGLSTATTAIVARRIGEKKHKAASIAAFQAIISGFAISLIIAIPGIIYSSEMLLLMGASEELVELYSGYTSIMLGGNVVIMLLFIINAVFRSSGDAAISMRVLWFANILNIILDPCLIFGLGPFPELGIVGAAIATTIGRGLAVIYQFYLLFNGKHRIRLSLSTLTIKFKVLIKLLRLSLGGMSQILIATSSWIFLVRIISVFGSEVIAGYTIGIRVIVFALLPSIGISNASATLVGQNLGANEPSRAEKSVWATGKINMILLGLISIVFIVYPEMFIRLFIDNQKVIESGASCLRIVSYGFVVYGLGMVIVNSFNGAGDTITPTIINLFCFWLIEIPLAYFLSITFGMNEDGVFYSIIISETLLTLSAMIIFKKGKWKLKKV